MQPTPYSLAFVFVGVGRISPDEERLVLLKPVVQFYFSYGVSRGFSLYLLYHNFAKFLCFSGFYYSIVVINNFKNINILVSALLRRNDVRIVFSIQKK